MCPFPPTAGLLDCPSGTACTEVTAAKTLCANILLVNDWGWAMENANCCLCLLKTFPGAQENVQAALIACRNSKQAMPWFQLVYLLLRGLFFPSFQPVALNTRQQKGASIHSQNRDQLMAFRLWYNVMQLKQKIKYISFLLCQFCVATLKGHLSSVRKPLEKKLR